MRTGAALHLAEQPHEFWVARTVRRLSGAPLKEQRSRASAPGAKGQREQVQGGGGYTFQREGTG